MPVTIEGRQSFLDFGKRCRRQHVTFLFMLPVFPLILAAYLPGRIKTAMKHPMLAAVKLWAFAHLLSSAAR